IPVVCSNLPMVDRREASLWAHRRGRTNGGARGCKPQSGLEPGEFDPLTLHQIKCLGRWARAGPTNQLCSVRFTDEVPNAVLSQQVEEARSDRVNVSVRIRGTAPIL